MKYKSIIIKSLIFCVTSFLVLYAAVMVCIITGGFRDNEAFCTKYIAPINAFKNLNGVYPESLDLLKKPGYSPRYDVNDCHYKVEGAHFLISVSHGIMGLAIYSSEWGEWVHD